jgi:hypothetical protein
MTTLYCRDGCAMSGRGALLLKNTGAIISSGMWPSREIVEVPSGQPTPAMSHRALTQRLSSPNTPAVGLNALNFYRLG